MSEELLAQRCREAAAVLLTAAGPRQLAEAIGQQAGLPLVLADHPWLRAAAGYFPTDLRAKIRFAEETAPLAPDQVDTAVLVGLGAVPETGSVLLPGRPAAAWRFSLCPRRLVVVIPAAQASLSLAQALAITAQEPSGLVSWLTGPSRTADIEKVLVLGAQGAAELAIISYNPRHISE
ncbi:MAG: LUD domain-containing protein [Desulfobacca sp.]|uniref:LUD domain-containing protein n=1 Tax=Desulfobacca sp. TaxID=2067990 RepID=UPI00404908A4